MAVENEYKVRFADAIMKLYSQGCVVQINRSLRRDGFTAIEVWRADKDRTRDMFRVLVYVPIPDTEGCIMAMQKISESITSIEAVAQLY
jgi:hypothetical protein